MRIDMVNNIGNINTENSEKSSAVGKVSSNGNKEKDFGGILKNVKQTKSIQNVSNTKADIKQPAVLDSKDKFKVSDSKVKNNKVSNSDGNKAAETDKESNELEEKINNLSSEQIIQCLSTIMDKLKEICDIKNSSMDMQSIESMDTVNSALKDLNTVLTNTLNDIIAEGKGSSVNFNTLIDTMQNGMESFGNINSNDSAKVVNNLLEILNKNNMDGILDNSNLSLANSLLKSLDVKLDEESANGKDNSFLKSLVSEVKSKIDDLLQQNNTIQNADINKNLQQNKDQAFNDAFMKKSDTSEKTSPVNKDVKDKLQSYDKNLSKESSDEKSNSKDLNSGFSRDEKILNSILKGNNSGNSNSFNMPVTTQVIFNNGSVAVEEVQVINKGTMVSDIIKTVKFMANNDMREMTVRINPENLGEVTIKLIEESGIMKMNIKVSSKETYSLLSQQGNEMKNQLSNQNIKIEDVNISLYEGDTTFFKGEEFNGNSFQENKRKNNNNNKSANREDSIDEENNNIKNINAGAVNMLA